MRLRSSFWFLQMAGWGGFLVLQAAIRTYIFHDAGKAVIITMIMDPCAFLLTLAMRACFRRMGIFTFNRWQVALGAVLCSLAAAAVMGSIWHGIILLTDWELIFATQANLRLIPMFYYFVILTAWSYLYFWLGAEKRADEEYERAIQAESETLRTELKFLRAQLDPHFLCNVLNGIVAEIPNRPAVASNMVSQLAGYLRYSLDHSEETRSSMAEEMRSVKSYLELSTTRFEDRLCYELDVCPTILTEPVPGCLLQPLVENAIKHGLKTGPEKLSVHIHASRTQAGLRVAVKNNGRLQDQWQMNQRGIGIKNLRRRLELLYPGRHQFSLRHEQDHVTAHLELQGEPCCA